MASFERLFIFVASYSCTKGFPARTNIENYVLKIIAVASSQQGGDLFSLLCFFARSFNFLHTQTATNYERKTTQNQ